MKKNFLFFLVLVLMFFLVLPVGFTTGQTEKKQEGEKGGLPFVTLKMYLLGGRVRDYDMMLEELNKLIKRDLNAKLEVEFIPWSGWRDKYRLLMSSGEPVDLIYTAGWAMYDEMVAGGAFRALEDIIPRVAPKLWKKIPQGSWEQTRRNGHIYMVPYNYKEVTSLGIIYRLDWAKEWGLGELKTLDDFENYCARVKQEKGMIPLNIAYTEPYVAQMVYLDDGVRKWPTRTLVQGMGIKYYVNDFNSVFLDWRSEAAKRWRIRIRRWYERGYIPKNVLANKTKSTDAFLNGTSASEVVNLNTAAAEYKRLKARYPNAEFGWLYGYRDVPVFPQTAINNGMAIPISGKHPERAVMLLEKLHTDQAYFDLTTYGIRGKHWDLDANGNIILPKGVTQATTGFPWDRACPWGWRETDLYRTGLGKDPSVWPIIKKLYNEGIKHPIYDKALTFAFNKDPVSAEVAACNAVFAQYSNPLIWGMVDPDSGLKLLEKKLKEAGFDKVYAEFEKQWKEYLSKNNLK